MDANNAYKAHLMLVRKCIEEAMEREDRYVTITLNSDGFLSVSVYPIDWLEDEESEDDEGTEAPL